MATQGISGTAIFATLIGGLLLYSGIAGKNFSSALQSSLAGKSPGTAGAANAIDLNASSGLDANGLIPNPSLEGTANNASQNQALAQPLAAALGWSGDQWTALVNLWNKESGWNATAQNPSSGAYGIAQSLHGSVGNEYNPSDAEGLSSAQLIAANQGSAYYQILWGLNYIRNHYGNPMNAWQHEVAYGWY